tara:strand:- start:191 stop:448 length:258 start_codon:yes stop_codon:yes gene_type:complete
MIMKLKDILVMIGTIGVEIFVGLKRNTRMLFLPSPASKLEKQLKKKMTESVELQRNGKIMKYAEASKKIFDMQEELEKLKKECER